MVLDRGFRNLFSNLSVAVDEFELSIAQESAFPNPARRR
jgi:hypothetical protein